MTISVRYLYAILSVCIPSGMITLSAVPSSKPAPRTDTSCNFSSDRLINNGIDPKNYEDYFR